MLSKELLTEDLLQVIKYEIGDKRWKAPLSVHQNAFILCNLLRIEGNHQSSDPMSSLWRRGTITSFIA